MVLSYAIFFGQGIPHTLTINVVYMTKQQWFQYLNVFILTRCWAVIRAHHLPDTQQADMLRGMPQ